jgi:hypothetical protein
VRSFVALSSDGRGNVGLARLTDTAYGGENAAASIALLKGPSVS